MKKQITLKQLARELGVSISTVSKAIHNSKEVSQDTREKIQAFAKFYNYRPNNIALSLKNKCTKTIGVIIPEIVHHFFSTVIFGIEQVANAKGYNVIVCLSDESFDKEVINMELLANGSIDGFIVSLSKETLAKKDYHHFLEILDEGIPVVLFDRVTAEIQCDKVIIDDTQAAYEAVNVLIRSGCKKIALITTVDYLSVGYLRTLGYQKALKEAGIAYNEHLIVKIEDTENCKEGIAALFERETFDGVFGVNEFFAVNAMKMAQNLGYTIPHDIAFIGFTDGLLSQCTVPALSTVAQNGQDMGRVAATMLIDTLEKENEEEACRTQIIKTAIIERESTAVQRSNTP
ncbi:LacI family DNA-binding transcriptional regulator [Arenibacter sp. GZD96]|uniref:LacI family DNA-binding transcriptional regulator n=1 Tax=Aurantibrevibacter litoralis TaxID=3106030 RepID=UPI002B0024AB|nr:LacI family DNA-binding transcriptional regulator [Arenibacter sp. GZD-96]MEA1785819.1 LacI family DNA-binding transcriptional regulator [Arenibacter sp. GZD-96]